MSIKAILGQNSNFVGIPKNNISTFKLSKFVDDQTLFIQDRNYLDIALQTIKIYEEGTAAKANLNKTEIFPIGPHVHYRLNPIVTDISILQYDAMVRFLGVQVRNSGLLLDKF